MHNRQDPCIWMRPVSVNQPFGIQYTAPLPFDLDYLNTEPPSHFSHPKPEEPVNPDNGGVARLEHIHQGRLHPCRPGA